MRALKTVPQFMDAMKDLGSEVHPSFDLSTFLWDWRLPGHWKSDEISPFEKVRIFDNEPNPAFLPTDALRDFVGLERFEIERTLGGVLTTTPDNMPIISEVEGISGLILAAGLFYGVTMAPVVGETVANIVTGKNPAFDLKPLRFSRFTDGSPTLYQP
eukprot:TRINITY_DN17878_c0_g2_i2.p2 TRINITY_DN17878_c0_g2~~TRINITY_DN17878_c0_g2_i2.p2  ORF type:complete len:158 (+),score=31.66 TRINITY_DN17878_c0_g2_i2:93-566(+)